MLDSLVSAVRLKGVDWFAWLTAGGSSAVLLASETGVAEIFITMEKAWIVTTTIESERLRAEEVSADFEMAECPWFAARGMDILTRKLEGGGRIISDRPGLGEEGLPESFLRLRLRFLPEEIARYRILAQEAAKAMTEALSACDPKWSEWRLAGEGARALWSRGLEPALILVGGEQRLPHWRHPVATNALIGGRAMMVFCARKHGLYANLTRFVSFRKSTPAEISRSNAVMELEATAFEHTRPGGSLLSVFESLRSKYTSMGFREQVQQQHFGGTTGYLSREKLASPTQVGSPTPAPFETAQAFAWNPTLPGAKIEDTVLLTETGLEVLTIDPAWPTVTSNGRSRPQVWEKP